MNANIGDKLWFRYFGTPPVIVGYLVETSPNKKLAKISDFDIKTYQSLSQNNRSNAGVWHEVRKMTVLDYLARKETTEKKFVGFTTIE